VRRDVKDVVVFSVKTHTFWERKRRKLSIRNPKAFRIPDVGDERLHDFSIHTHPYLIVLMPLVGFFLVPEKPNLLLTVFQ
jgi:hypothetical protein